MKRYVLPKEAYPYCKWQLGRQHGIVPKQNSFFSALDCFIRLNNKQTQKKKHKKFKHKNNPRPIVSEVIPPISIYRTKSEGQLCLIFSCFYLRIRKLILISLYEYSILYDSAAKYGSSDQLQKQIPSLFHRSC